MNAFREALVQAGDPAFTGTIAVEVSSKDGRLGGPKVTVVRWPQSS